MTTMASEGLTYSFVTQVQYAAGWERYRRDYVSLPMATIPSSWRRIRAANGWLRGRLHTMIPYEQ